MRGEMLFVFAVASVAGAMFISGKVRNDIVALLVVLALVLCGVMLVVGPGKYRLLDFFKVGIPLLILTGLITLLLAPLLFSFHS